MDLRKDQEIPGIHAERMKDAAQRPRRVGMSRARSISRLILVAISLSTSLLRGDVGDDLTPMHADTATSTTAVQ